MYCSNSNLTLKLNVGAAIFLLTSPHLSFSRLLLCPGSLYLSLHVCSRQCCLHTVNIIRCFVILTCCQGRRLTGDDVSVHRCGEVGRGLPESTELRRRGSSGGRQTEAGTCKWAIDTAVCLALVARFAPRRKQ